ncbi:hypothetical protein GCM10009634_60660 [Saccharothrix xinjiangensis]
MIHNAANFDQSLRRPRYTSAGHELIWATNHLGPFRLTAALSGLPRAASHPKVVTTPRIRIRFGHLDGAGWYSPTRACYHLKPAQIMFSFEPAARTAGHVDVTCLRVPAVRLGADRLAGMPRPLRVLADGWSCSRLSPGTRRGPGGTTTGQGRPGLMPWARAPGPGRRTPGRSASGGRRRRRLRPKRSGRW